MRLIPVAVSKEPAETGRLLVVNADDFGMSPEVNDAVLRAYRGGALTSCSLMVAGEAFDDAVRIARENPGLAVGLHLVTVCGRSVLGPEEIPSIVDGSGRLPDNPGIAGLRYFFHPVCRREIRREIRAQFQKFASTGLPFSHVDGHLHMHIHPVVFDEILHMARRYGVRSMRVPDDDFHLVAAFDGVRSPGRRLYDLVFRIFSRRMKRVLGRCGLSFTDRVFGNFLSGAMSEEYALFVLDHAGDVASAEIYFHPACYGPGRPSTPIERRRLREFHILMSPTVIARTAERDFRLGTYADIEAEQ